MLATLQRRNRALLPRLAQIAAAPRAALSAVQPARALRASAVRSAPVTEAAATNVSHAPIHLAVRRNDKFAQVNGAIRTACEQANTTMSNTNCSAAFSQLTRLDSCALSPP